MAQVLPDFSSWITGLDLSSPENLENKIDLICSGIEDRLNPKNEIEYIKVMQSHLLLEVWSQIRIFITEQFQKNEYFTNACIKGLNYNTNKPQTKQSQKRRRNKNPKPASYTASLKLTSMGKSIQIPHHSYLLLLWKPTKSFLDLNAITDELKQMEIENDDESKNMNDDAKSTYPPHVMAQVGNIKMNKKQQNKYQSQWDVKLN